jgi:hypothetical protein
MVRKSLWIGLRLGILAGVVFAVVKTFQARRAIREPIAPPASWRPPERAPAAPPAAAPVREAPRRETPMRPGPPRPTQPPMPPRPSVATPPPTPPPPEPTPPPAAEPKKAAKKAAKRAKKAAKATPAAPSGRAWVEPDEGACPQSHPVKAKLSSKIFHLPGMLAYDRTNADRCYSDADAATGDGFRAAKR